MKRLTELRQSLEQKKLDAFLVTNLRNIRYLANFTGTTAALLITQTEAIFITDSRYTQQAKQQAQGFTLHQNEQPLLVEVNDLLQDLGIQQLAVEADDLSAAQYLHIQELYDATIEPTQGIVEQLRQIKDEEELAIIQAACDITDQAFDHILDYIQPGITEIEVANELERFLKAKGASGMSFDTIVASGVRSSMPHGVASDKVIEVGDFVTMDFGCYYQGYASDMTRTIAVGEPDPKLKEIYQIVLDAHLKVIAETKAGMTGRQVDAIARDYITQHGYGEQFGHSTGHGLGLDVHEAPSISRVNDQPLEVNMVITDEPGIYLDGLGGVRIEDDLVIQSDGVYSLNHSPKELIILPFD